MDIITDKSYVLKAIGNALETKVVSERAGYKAQELAKVALSDFSLRVINVTLLQQPTFSKNSLIIQVKAARDNTPLRVDNPLIFINPPIMVWDGTYHEEINQEFRVTLKIMNYIENPLMALQEIIIKAIESQN